MSPSAVPITPELSPQRVKCTGTAAVVGGGIAGLSAAVALRRAGWSVSIYERSKFKNEVGAGITVPPNAGLVLRHLGFDFEKARPVANETTRMSRGRDQNGAETEDSVENLGSWMFHRVDLHRGLRELAEDPDEGDGKGRKVDMNLGVAVEKVDCENGVLTISGGRTVKVDLSSLLHYFTSTTPQVQRTGRSIYRWLVSMSDVLADPLTSAHYLPESPTGFIAFSDPRKRVLWVSYLCRGGTVLNNAVLHDTQPDEETDSVSEWHSGVTKGSVLAQLENFDESRRSIVNMASEDGIKVHRLFKRPALSSFVRGRTVVVGDAAHVMLPTHAAGGSLAIESAAALEVLFRGADGKNDEMMMERLRVFDALRVPRCNLAMIVSNAGGPWTGDAEIEREVRRFYQGPLPSVGTLPWMKEFRDVLFHHDAYRAAQDALSKVRLPNY
ncbi:3-hydroxybenzoate 6-hydroxylase [Naviculisporaceae sp. PSN 640]